ncbi:olfactory receptor 6F1-like [Erpetoichthys calabaricus]|uniref:olfactory receptor 6F1-like n=1 Tax=Erpetoichthys calabaricus TaxID=27687 RepID=UPI00109F7497|nr:olfactory receptor 6F1-like [Erpetoichthys calabaricus]
MQVNGSKPASLTEFELVGFPGLLDYKILLFVGCLLLLLITLTANFLILLLVSLDHRLHTPMYFFLCNLSLLDILMTTAIIPKLLAVLSGYNKTISFAGCFAQMYFVVSVGTTENFLLAAMAYDRYIAVVKPLHYNVIIDFKKCMFILSIVLALGFFMPFVFLVLIIDLPYCGSNKVMHCFCDFSTVIALACTDISYYANSASGVAMFGNYVPLLFVLWTYARIVNSVLKLKTTESLSKAFSMCFSHATVVSVHYVSASIAHAVYNIQTLSYDGRIFVGGLNYFLMPVANPMIYSLRNEKIKDAAKRYLHFSFLFSQNAKNSIIGTDKVLPKDG